ncbi:hypothetical protein HAZT_HAZT003820 [Hyalella azteca]|uniref:Protein AAR2 homolog n=1 Tax=Hyalella azteca TaxID=294128 RepID=A0A6A0GUM2_HYAAZ|nr:hypothetical protein HAZT_HAZT003820 [Hyalella azteca]
MASYTSHEEKDFEKFLQCKGAALVLLNVPVHTEIGIDMHSWTIGPKFKGINLIPPGLHFINYSAVSKYGETAPATGFFHYFEPNDVLVKVYQPATEEFKDESPEQTERVKINLQSLRGELGPYPSELWRRWVSLTQKIDRRHLESVLPLSEKQMRSTAKRLINEGLPELVPVAGLDFRWYELPERTHKAGATPAYITAVCIDPTPILDDLIRHLGK